MIKNKTSAFLSALTLGFLFLTTPHQVEAQYIAIGAQNVSAADVVLVLPFENISDHPEYNWIGESFADSLSSLLDKPGLIVVSSDERAVAYQRLRLPLTVIPSRATAIKLARELKASMVVFGNYNVMVPPTA